MILYISHNITLAIKSSVYLTIPYLVRLSQVQYLYNNVLNTKNMQRKVAKVEEIFQDPRESI